MKKLIIGFSYHPGSIFSWLIRTVTKSKVGHVYTREPSLETGLNLIFQASGLVVNYCNSKTFLEKAVVVEEYEITITDEQYLKNQIFKQTEVGKPYSMKQVYGYAWVLFARQYLNKKVANPWSNGNKAYVCVETGADQTGLISLEDSEGWTPEDLRRWCMLNGQLIKA